MVLKYSGQTGVPHPQAPNVESAKMYKVLREIAENTTTGTRSDTSLAVGGRVRDGKMKEMLAKQLNVGLSALESQPIMDLKTGAISSKKKKKEKTPEQNALAEAKVLSSKCPSTTFVRFDHFLKPLF